MRTRAALLLAALSTGCAPVYLPTPGTIPLGTIFQDSGGPMAYRSATPADVGGVRAAPAQVHGESCEYALVVPPAFGAGFLNDPTQTNLTKIPTIGIAWGDAGVARAMEKAKGNARGARLYDVRIDSHTISVLGIWVRACTEVHASVAPPA